MAANDRVVLTSPASRSADFRPLPCPLSLPGRPPNYLVVRYRSLPIAHDIKQKRRNSTLILKPAQHAPSFLTGFGAPPRPRRIAETSSPKEEVACRGSSGWTRPAT